MIKLNLLKKNILNNFMKGRNSKISNFTQNESAGKLKLSELKFINTHLNNLFVKEVKDPKRPQPTKGCNYTRVQPTPVENPKIYSISRYCAEMLGLDYKSLIDNKDNEAAEYLSGNKLINTSDPSSHCYCGHQFGVFAGQLGDGRAITLGDVYGDADEPEQLWELQLKGSGLTPYSRFADGRAVLRSSIREYLCSEHLWALGIPTTRALSLVGSDSKVQRDPLYNGNVIYEECAIVCRVAPNFFRFGSFEIFKDTDMLTGSSGPSPGMEKEMLSKMLDYLGKLHFSKLYNEYNHQEEKSVEEYYEKLYKLVCTRTAILAAYWQCYGFCHGVLNTDNMSFLGLTIDYGPYGFLEFFDKFFICNHSDKNGRYAYMQQPTVCKWNLEKLAEAISSALPMEKAKNILENTYDKVYQNFYYFLNAKKIGLFLSGSNEIISKDQKLIDDLYNLLDDFGYDLTLFFRNLAQIDDTEQSLDNFVKKMSDYSTPFKIKLQKIKPTMNTNLLNTLKAIKEKNPFVLYNYGLDPDSVQNEIDRAEKYTEFKNNYSEEKFNELKDIKLKEWLKLYKERLYSEYLIINKNEVNIEERIKLLTQFFEEDLMLKYPLSKNAYKNIIKDNCMGVLNDFTEMKGSINDIQEFNKFKLTFMNKINPKFILRNHVVQSVIEKAEGKSFDELQKLFDIITTPFDEHEKEMFEGVYDTTILQAYNVCVSCSS